MSLYYSPAYRVERALSIAKDAIASLHGYDHSDFEPELEYDSRLFASDRDEQFETLFAPLTMKNPSPSDGRPFTISVSQIHDEASGWATIGGHVPFRSGKRVDVEKAWRVALFAAPRMVEATRPVFAEINGIGESGIRFRDLAAGQLPPTFGPWNYLAGSLIEATGISVAKALAGCGTSPLLDGIVVQPARDPYEPPPRECIRDLRELVGPVRFRYHQSMPPG